MVLDVFLVATSRTFELRIVRDEREDDLGLIARSLMEISKRRRRRFIYHIILEVNTFHTY
jgi:hypothetical protein